MRRSRTETPSPRTEPAAARAGVGGQAATRHEDGHDPSAGTPLVSVVIPAYEAATHIGTALDSAFRQTYARFEVIVVNDGSPDTAELERALEPYEDRIRYVRQSNRGPGGARNTGIRMARGDWVALLDADDLWRPEFLQRQVALLRSRPGADLVYCDALLVGDSPLAGRTFMQTTPSHGEATFDALLRRECVVITSCVVARRAALERAGLFDERFHHSEDFDLWVRMLLTGSRIAYQRDVLAEHRIHGGSLTTVKGALLRGQIAICRNWQRGLDLSPDERTLVRAHREWCRSRLRLIRGKRALREGRFERARPLLVNAARSIGGAKLNLVSLGVRVSPRLLRKVLLMREREVEGVREGGAA